MKIIKATTQQHYFDLMSIRIQVFILEQNVSASIELDEYDRDAIHYVCYIDGKAVGTCRIVDCKTYGKIGRVCVLKEYRHLGIGKALMDALENDNDIKKMKVLKLGAQLSAIAFYEKLGYTTYGDVFLDANIKHMMMKKEM